MLEITHIPKTKDYIKGVINLRGEIIPVIDLRSEEIVLLNKEAV